METVLFKILNYFLKQRPMKSYQSDEALNFHHIIKQQLTLDNQHTLMSQSSLKSAGISQSLGAGKRRSTHRSGVAASLQIKENESQSSNYAQSNLLDLSNQQLVSFDDAYTTLVDLCHEQKENERQVLTFTHLDLSNNRMTTLLKNDVLRKQLFSMFQTMNSQQSKKGSQQRKYKRKQKTDLMLLENVHHLNVLNNFEVEDVQDFVDQIVILMPEVRDLHISLSLEEDVSYIIDHMPKLELLNGIRVERDHINSNEEEEKPLELGEQLGGTFQNNESNHSQNPHLQKKSLGYPDGTMETIDAQLQQNLQKDILSVSENTLVDNSNMLNREGTQQDYISQPRSIYEIPPDKLSQAQANLPQLNQPGLDEEYILAQASIYAKKALANCQKEFEEQQRNAQDYPYMGGSLTSTSQNFEINRPQFDQNLSRIYEQTDENLTSNFQNSKNDSYNVPQNVTSQPPPAFCVSSKQTIGLPSVSSQAVPRQCFYNSTDFNEGNQNYPDMQEFVGEAYMSLKELQKSGNIDSNYVSAPMQQQQTKVFDYNASQQSLPGQRSIQQCPEELPAEPYPKLDSKDAIELENYPLPSVKDKGKDANDQQATDGEDDSQESDVNVRETQNLKEIRNSILLNNPPAVDEFAEGRQEQLSEILEEETETEQQIMGAGLVASLKKQESSKQKLIKKSSKKSPPKHNFQPKSEEQKQSPQQSARQILDEFQERTVRQPDIIVEQSDQMKSCKDESKDFSDFLLAHNDSSQNESSILKDHDISQDDQDQPQLKPKDLEELANVFDHIRVLYKKKDEAANQSQKKLISKAAPAKVDEQAALFDKKLTEIMVKLSKVLKDPLISTSQKRAEIEKSKFLLNVFCTDTTLKFIWRNRTGVTPKELKEIHWILQKQKEGLSNSFLNLGSLFYSKAEDEVQQTCDQQIANYKQVLSENAQEIAALKQEVEALKQSSDSQIKDLRGQLHNTKEQLESTKRELQDQAWLCEEREAEIKSQSQTIVQIKQQFEKTSFDLRETKEKLGSSEKQVQNLNEQMRASEARGRDSLERIIKIENDKMRIEQELKTAVAEHKALEQKLIIDKEQQQQLKDEEIKKLNSAMSLLNQEIQDKSIQNDQLTSENQNYLDIIIKFSLSGKIPAQAVNLMQNKTLKQQYLALKKGVKTSSNIYELGSQLDNKSMLCPSNYGRSPLLPGQKKSGSLVKRKKKSQIDKNSNFGGKSLSPLPVGIQQDGFIQQEGIEISNHQPSPAPKHTKSRSRSNMDMHDKKSTSRSPIKGIKGRQNQSRMKLDGSFELGNTSVLIQSQLNLSQRSYDDLGQTAKKAKKTINKSASKNKSARKGSVTPKSKHVKTAGMDQNESHDGHKISMDDCEPSPQKTPKKSNFSPTPEKKRKHSAEEALLRQQSSGYKENSMMKKKYKERQGRIGRLNIEKSRDDQIQGKQQVVPSLQFNGIGFSFNEASNKNILNIDQPVGYLQKSQSRTGTMSPPASSSQRKFITTKVLNQPQLRNQVLSTDPFVQNHLQAQYSIRSKSTPSNSVQNFHFVGGQMGNLPERIQGTSQLPVASLQQNQANQIQILIRNRLKETDQGEHRSNERGPGSSVLSPEFRASEKIQPWRQRRNLSNSISIFTSQNRKSHNLSQSLQKRGSSASAKTMSYTLKQMRDLIADIYLQKVKHDEKCVNQYQQSRETMEQYLYTYLNQKYGLKSLVKDQACAIIQGISNYQDQDHEVKLFGKVLRHEVDEEFRYVQLTIKSTIQQLLRQNLREKNPTKSSIDIQTMWQDIQNGKSQLDYSIWTKIISHMYEANDVNILQQSLRALGQRKQQKVDSEKQQRKGRRFTLAQ